MMLKQALGVMAPAGPRARLSVLIFHRVLPETDPLFPDEVNADRFDQICAWLKSWLQVLPLDQAVTRLKAGTLPARSACITFDDGYADNHDVAMPILQRHGLTSTFFIATGFLDGGCMWNDVLIETVRRTALPVLHLAELLGDEFAVLPVGTVEQKRGAIRLLIDRLKYLSVAERSQLAREVARLGQVPVPDDLMMTSRQVVGLHQGGMSVGAHTVSHPILARLDRADAMAEVGQSKSVLEGLLQQPVRLFAYPNGKPGTDYVPDNVEVVRELGFAAAVSTRWAASTQATDPFQIPRFTPWDRTRFKFGTRLAANLRRT